ncbi:DUF3164 family protein [Otariodibacter oris]|uniref:Uncharacterized protein DUF3164 n=1 Tax=Otariodibacter oris TaxID=1032623 RepID=A0A420XJ37_9PAST|nr:DUF3164 family protein [Otariodibacter oris]QGM80690.1 sulfate transporter [Otariodibacter oris]RKR77148.1 uncharacterized protein DUF3164 [Otariodibacter oris]
MKTQIDGKNYWEDAQGRLMAEDLIKDIDKERDELVNGFIEKAKELQAQMKKFKAEVSADVQAFIELSAEKYGVQLGGRKGNTTLLSFDGKLKLQVAVSERVGFDERIQAAKALIDECLHEWSGEARPELKVLINDAFQVDKEGNLSTQRILSLRRVDIQDERWTEAMKAISDSVQVVGSKDYIRFYERDAQGKYIPISLDIAGL